MTESNVIIKNIGKVIMRASCFVRNILNKKKKKALTSIFIINIMPKFMGGKKMAKEAINPRIKIRNINFFPNLPVACIMTFNYNRFL